MWRIAIGIIIGGACAAMAQNEPLQNLFNSTKETIFIAGGVDTQDYAHKIRVDSEGYVICSLKRP